ncbi:uncharacterized protein PHACADRAFT_253587 [Phanerochaete carnosa HHB-10118-sp]|uniref:Uncharacterized protein n=1 Tax=Phanerochaete carnosa (strain HHB-10118-sp) TaxID=650164 RepID=K5WBU5_PHACS|nr:uncharacterized protein PHACADRAFT_253587 [Phanerochaete carnosa HHB-10118-sp]EKM56449.1 hypothetical protein PHACADRAFT_253587 [Phanerochaete carnosa HHB-10118-sp]
MKCVWDLYSPIYRPRRISALRALSRYLDLNHAGLASAPPPRIPYPIDFAMGTLTCSAPDRVDCEPVVSLRQAPRSQL